MSFALEKHCKTFAILIIALQTSCQHTIAFCALTLCLFPEKPIYNRLGENWAWTPAAKGGGVGRGIHFVLQAQVAQYVGWL